MLEERLDQLDQEERSPLFLGKSRIDRNADRTSLLAEIDSCLADYGEHICELTLFDIDEVPDHFAIRTSRMVGFSPAQQRDVASLGNCLEGTGCLAREETAYLMHHRELLSLAPVNDSAVMQLENWVEDKLIRFHRGFRKVRDTLLIRLQAYTTHRADIMIFRWIQMYTYILGPGSDALLEEYCYA
jgi:hypothetical protein